MPTYPLTSLHRIHAEYGPGLEARKLALLTALDRARLPSSAAVQRLHEMLCFLRACPDGPRLLARVERMLRRFDRRADLRRHAAALADSGIAGTEIRYPFYLGMAEWITGRWPERVRVDWEEMTESQLATLESRLGHLALVTESPGLDELDLGLRGWVDHLRGSEGDAAFLVKSFAALKLPEGMREAFYEDMDLPLVLAPGRGGPSRTLALGPRGKIAFQDHPLRRGRPDLGTEIRREPLGIRVCLSAEARAYLDLAKEAMITRSRDLDAFAFGDPKDVRVVDWEDGLQFVAIGMVPARRLVFESVYGYLTLKNGVPIGYVLNSALFGSAEIAYNVFETWRGAEAAFVYSRVLATVCSLFGADTFTIYPYQLGDHNEEGLKSGAWWFYQKLGFRPKDPTTLRLMRRELARMKRKPEHRSSISTLMELARENVYFHAGPERDDVMGLLPLAYASLCVSRMIGQRFGADRSRAAKVLLAEARELLGDGPGRGWSAGERLAFERWAPIAVALPGVGGWSPADRRALAGVMRAKGGRHESDFVKAFDAHPKLRSALLALGRRGERLQ